MDKTELYNLLKQQYEETFEYINKCTMNRKQRRLMEAELKKMIERRHKSN